MYDASILNLVTLQIKLNVFKEFIADPAHFSWRRATLIRDPIKWLGTRDFHR